MSFLLHVVTVPIYNLLLKWFLLVSLLDDFWQQLEHGVRAPTLTFVLVKHFSECPNIRHVQVVDGTVEGGKILLRVDLPCRPHGTPDTEDEAVGRFLGKAARKREIIVRLHTLAP